MGKSAIQWWEYNTLRSSFGITPSLGGSVCFQLVWSLLGPGSTHPNTSRFTWGGGILTALRLFNKIRWGWVVKIGMFPGGGNKPAFQLVSQAGAGDTGRASLTSISGQGLAHTFFLLAVSSSRSGNTLLGRLAQLVRSGNTLRVLRLYMNRMQPAL